MKTTVRNLREMLKKVFVEAGHVDRSKRHARGYAEANADVDYLDVANEAVEEEGVSQAKRLAHGYDLDSPADYDVPGEGLPAQQEGEEEIAALRAVMAPRAPADSYNPGSPVDMVDLVRGGVDQDDGEAMMSGDADEELDESEEGPASGFIDALKALMTDADKDDSDPTDKFKHESKIHTMPSLKSIFKK